MNKYNEQKHTEDDKLSDVKRKDEPEDKSLNQEEDTNTQLKNTNLSQDEDLANRNKDDNRRIWEKDR